jgi:hypothetical protein
MESDYDFIIIGAGSAGATLAALMRGRFQVTASALVGGVAEEAIALAAVFRDAGDGGKVGGRHAYAQVLHRRRPCGRAERRRRRSRAATAVVIRSRREIMAHNPMELFRCPDFHHGPFGDLNIR